MADTVIAGVRRAGIYSPNHIGNDAAIFNLAADQLRKRGYVVNIYSEEQFLAMDTIAEDVVMNMCRMPQSIAKLQKLEQQGKLVINSGFGIENCTRIPMTRQLLGMNIPYPDSLIVDTNQNIVPMLAEGHYTRCWIKRGDCHGQHKEDVSYVRNPQEAQEVLHEYFLRGIPRAVINRHLEGDNVKFYGIRGTNFFYWFYPFRNGTEDNQPRISLQPINGEQPGMDFDADEMRAICQKAADILDVDIYGGDCIIAPDHSVRIIDFNDWPSFAPCRTEAAPYIAKSIIASIKKFKKK